MTPPARSAEGYDQLVLRHIFASSSLRACPEMLGQISRQQVIQMHGGARTFIYAVSAIGISHEIEWFPEFDELVYQQLRPLIVDIVVAGPMHNQQMALQSFREIDC